MKIKYYQKISLVPDSILYSKNGQSGKFFDDVYFIIPPDINTICDNRYPFIQNDDFLDFLKNEIEEEYKRDDGGFFRIKLRIRLWGFLTNKTHFNYPVFDLHNFEVI